MKVIEVLSETCVDGPGMRMSIYVSGCEHMCHGCHNPSTWNFNQGVELTDDYIDQIIDDFNGNPLLYGLTFSGGDPLHPKNVAGINKFLEVFYRKAMPEKQNVWIYTGFEIRQLVNRIQLWSVNSDNQDYLLENIFKNTDIIVDGEFVDYLRDVTLKYRGSSNQRFFAAKDFMAKYRSLFKLNEARLLEFDVTRRYGKAVSA